MWSVLSILPEISLILFRFQQFCFYLINYNLNEFDSTTKANHILEITGLGGDCGYCTRTIHVEITGLGGDCGYCIRTIFWN